MRQVRNEGGSTVSCPLRPKTGKHVYAHKGDEYKCGCGRTVKYDIVARDFVAVDPK